MNRPIIWTLRIVPLTPIGSEKWQFVYQVNYFSIEMIYSALTIDASS